MIIEITKDNIKEVFKNNKKILLQFHAEWCGPCKRLSPILDQLSKEYPDWVIGKINTSTEYELSVQFGIKSLPTLLIWKDNMWAKTIYGFQLKNTLAEYLKN